MRARAILSVLVVCAAAAVALAADASVGTWKLNAAKSKLSPNGPRNNTVVIAAAGDNMKVTVDGTGRDAKPSHNEWTGKFDGKDYPVTGDTDTDMRSYTRVDDHTFTLAGKKGGKVVTSGRIVISADGKTRTVTTTTTDAEGKKTSATSVYEKQ